MKKKRKWTDSGIPFKTVTELIEYAKENGIVMWQGKPKNWSIVKSQRVKTLIDQIAFGKFTKPERNKDDDGKREKPH